MANIISKPFEGPCIVAEFKTKKAAEKFAKRVVASKVWVKKNAANVYQILAER